MIEKGIEIGVRLLNLIKETTHFNYFVGFNRDRGNFRDSDRGRFDSNKEDRRGFGSRRFENDRDGISRDRDDRDSDRVSCKCFFYVYIKIYF